MTGIEKVLDKEDGSATSVAKKLSAAGYQCSRQRVEHWVRNGYVPGKWAPHLNRLYRVPLQELIQTNYPQSAA